MMGRKPRIIIEMPPRHGKSELVSHYFPVWVEETWPDKRIILCSYGADLAADYGRRARNTIINNQNSLIVRLAEDYQERVNWMTTAGGGMVSAGIGGPIGGKGADVLIIDDPIKNEEEARSLVYRNKIWEWWTWTARPRLEPGACVILVMTRWHRDDFAGRLISEQEQGGETWEILRLPALAEENDPLDRKPGEALWSERFDETKLAEIKLGGVRAFSALYQQNPTPEEGAIFKREWFHIVDRAPDGLKWVRGWDLATSTKTSASYTASPRCALGPDGMLYIADMVRGRWEWPDARKIIIQQKQAEKGLVRRIGIEKVAFQNAAIQELLREPELADIALKGIAADSDKVSRAETWSWRAEAGKITLVRGQWNHDFLEELAEFPNGANDDQVDAVSICVSMLPGMPRPRLSKPTNEDERRPIVAGVRKKAF